MKRIYGGRELLLKTKTEAKHREKRRVKRQVKRQTKKLLGTPKTAAQESSNLN